MKKTSTIKLTTMIALSLILLTTAFGIGTRVGAAGDTPGSINDPLITESYLEKTLADYNASNTFNCTTVKSGKTITYKQGVTVLLYSGSATATGTMVDITTGKTISKGETLYKYHLYLVPSDDTGIKASSTSVIFTQE